MGLSTTGEQRNTEYFKLKYSPSSPESIMRGSNCHTTDHHRTVPWVELSPVHQFCRFRKAFDSVDIDTLWKLLRHYGVPVKIVNIIRSSYEGLPCSVIHRGQPTEAFNVRAGVRQGCLLSPFLFLIAIDWVMRTATAQARNGIQWTLWLQLGDLNFAEDLTLLSHTHRQMQEKTNSV